MKQLPVIPNIRLEKFVHGGQVIARLPSGKSVFVWGGLPGELVTVKVLKQRSSYSEAIVTEVLEPSSERVDPLEPSVYLSTSPWQIVSFTAENAAKQTILEETFTREGLELDWQPFVAGIESEKYRLDLSSGTRVQVADDPIARSNASEQLSYMHYRNKMEFGFFGDDDGLHLAHYVRGSHGKQICDGSVLALDQINIAARAVRDELNRLKIWGGDLKTLILRCSQAGDVVAALFIKKDDDSLRDFVLPNTLNGIDIFFSNPKSPASVPTKKLRTIGSTDLQDTIFGKTLNYNVLSFFQVNVPVFTRALSRMDEYAPDVAKIDLYSGVGSIGVALKNTDMLIESADDNIRMAQKNVLGTNIKVVHATSESAIEHIDDAHVVIVDPPRAGLHDTVVQRLLEVCPPNILYLSCNPSTQARDIAKLIERYSVTLAEGYNFFPRTPHIESLILLKLAPHQP